MYIVGTYIIHLHSKHNTENIFQLNNVIYGILIQNLFSQLKTLTM